MMVTAYGDDDRRGRARELGAFEFIPKRVDFDQLKAQLRQLPNAAHGSCPTPHIEYLAASEARIAARRRVWSCRLASSQPQARQV